MIELDHGYDLNSPILNFPSIDLYKSQCSVLRKIPYFAITSTNYHNENIKYSFSNIFTDVQRACSEFCRSV